MKIRHYSIRFENLDGEKDLGVSLDEDLMFNEQINSQLNPAIRNIRVFLGLSFIFG